MKIPKQVRERQAASSLRFAAPRSAESSDGGRRLWDCGLATVESGFTMIESPSVWPSSVLRWCPSSACCRWRINVQKDNREETIINQDLTVLWIYRIGASSPYGSDLTNYVYAITNSQTRYSPGPAPGYLLGWGNNTYLMQQRAHHSNFLSMPEYTDLSLNPTNNFFSGGYSNYVVAYVRSISGPASENHQDQRFLQLQNHL